MEISRARMFSDRLICDVRQVPLTEALERIGAFWHVDKTYRPKRDKATRLLLVENQYEMTMTEPKFILRRRGKRDRIAEGGGAIDLVMSIKKCSFPDAVRLLLEEGERNEKP